VNLSDVPELMLGAQCSANPAQRMEFETRCRELYEEDIEEQYQGMQSASRVDLVSSMAAIKSLEDMFPGLDPELVRALAVEASSPQAAMDTLLSLTAAIADPAMPPQRPKDLSLGDAIAFPSLVGADGCEVASRQQLEGNLDEDLGSAWCDRAKAIASIPAPQPPATAAAAVATLRKCVSQQGESNKLVASQPDSETEYELRQRLGKDRLSNRKRSQLRRSSKAGSSDCWPATTFRCAGDHVSDTSSEAAADHGAEEGDTKE
jgi:hypothetical protein